MARDSRRTGVTSGFRGAESRAKRLIDVLMAAGCLVVAAPLMACIGLAIRLTSPGPALFRQTRVGQGGRLFVLLKFRTMDVGAPEAPTDVIAGLDHSPVTAFGRILRRTSLDELPQLVNVLRGEMSIVGPRPALPSQRYLNDERRRLGVDRLQPGITGWAQVEGRDSLTDAEKVACDAYYLERASLSFDAVIAMRTVLAVFTGRGNR